MQLHTFFAIANSQTLFVSLLFKYNIYFVSVYFTKIVYVNLIMAQVDNKNKCHFKTIYQQFPNKKIYMSTKMHIRISIEKQETFV